MGLFSSLDASTPKTAAQLDMECGSLIARGDYQKAARIAHNFRNYAQQSSHFDDAEKLPRFANAYYWMCKATFQQIVVATGTQLYELLVAFFAAHKVGTYYLQKVLAKGTLLDLDDKHPLYPRYEELNRLYDAIYRSKDNDTVAKADREANERVRW